jgi:hypothetical protein
MRSTAVRYPAFGITITPNDELDFALVYRDEAKIELDIDAELRGTVDTGILPVPARYELESTTMNAFIPRQLVLGGSWRASKQLSVGLDVTWVNWSAYESPVSQSSSVLDVDVPAGFDLPPNPKPTKKLDPGFENRLVPRIGLEYRLPLRRRLELPLRAGYVFERSPVPPQTGRTNFADADRHVLSLGAGFIWSEPGEVLPVTSASTRTCSGRSCRPTSRSSKTPRLRWRLQRGGSQLGVGATLDGFCEHPARDRFGARARGCATLASEAGDPDAIRLTAGAGPFRPITQSEPPPARRPTCCARSIRTFARRPPLTRGRGAGPIALRGRRARRTARDLPIRGARCARLRRARSADAGARTERRMGRRRACRAEWPASETRFGSTTRPAASDCLLERWRELHQAAEPGSERRPELDGRGRSARRTRFIQFAPDDFAYFRGSGPIGEARSSDGLSCAPARAGARADTATADALTRSPW